MKKLALVFAFASLVFAACEKKESLPTSTTATPQREVNVEYRITNESSNVAIEYIAPAGASANLITHTAVVNKTYEAISFTSKSNNFFSISAKNANVTTQDITVDIYVDGVLFKSGSLNHATMTASASGKVE